ncbi:MAG: KdsC family phosphatase [Gammaproteobacteria bacterium]
MTAVEARAARVQLAVFDVDGVFTDGQLHYAANGELFKSFHVRDGHGVKRLLQAGIDVAVISGRTSAAATRRLQELGIHHVFQGADDKLAIFRKLLAQLGLEAAQAACVGDDLPDLPLLQAAGLAVAVVDAEPAVRACAHYVTRARGGAGAVREICELLLAARAAQA